MPLARRLDFFNSARCVKLPLKARVRLPGRKIEVAEQPMPDHRRFRGTADIHGEFLPSHTRTRRLTSSPYRTLRGTTSCYNLPAIGPGTSLVLQDRRTVPAIDEGTTMRKLLAKAAIA